MGDDALLLALDDGDMDFGDINFDLLDEDDDVVDVTEPADNKQVRSQSQGDDLRHKVDLKKISRMSSGVFEDGLSGSKRKVQQSANRRSHFKHKLYGNFKRRTTPPTETVNRGYSSPVKLKSLSTKNYKIPMKKDPRSRVTVVEPPKSPVQNRPPLFTKNFVDSSKPQAPSCSARSLPFQGAVSSQAESGSIFPPDFSMPPPSTFASSSRLVVNKDPQPTTPNSSPSPVFRFGAPSPKNSPGSLLNTSIEQLEKMKGLHESKKREEEAKMEELERVLTRKKMEEDIKMKEKEREAALIRRLQMKQVLGAEQNDIKVDLQPPQSSFSGQARTKPPPVVDMTSLMAQQLKMMHEMTNSFMTNMAEREADRKRTQEKREMTQMKSSIMNMEKLLYSGQIAQSPYPSTFSGLPSHARINRLPGPVPIRDRLTLPKKDEVINPNNRYSNYNNRHSNYNNNAPALKRFKTGHGQIGDGMSLPDDLVLTEITEDGPKAARKKISFSSD